MEQKPLPCDDTIAMKGKVGVSVDELAILIKCKTQQSEIDQQTLYAETIKMMALIP